jgi:Iap family predicted aminopeptidase
MADIETLRTSLPRTRSVALALAIIVEISEEDREFHMPNWLWEEAARRGYFARRGI